MDLIKNGDCSRENFEDGFYFYDEKRYKLFVSLSSVLMTLSSNLSGIMQN